MIWLAGVLILLPWLLLSSADFVGYFRAAALVGVAFYAKRVFPDGWKGLDRSFRIIVFSLLAVHASILCGGRLHGSNIFMDLGISLLGLVGICGFATLLSLLLDPPWKARTLKLSVWIVSILLVCSLAAYFIPVERYIQIGPSPQYFDSSRLVMIFPTRLATQWMGQLVWSHTNHAALLFGSAAIFILEYLAGNPAGRRWPWWVLGTGLCTAVFLTGSRTGWLMLLSALPFVLIRRTPWLTLKTLLAAAVVLGLGMGALKTKLTMIDRQAAAAAASSTPVAPPAPDYHMSGLLQRGSTGRTAGYEILWKETEGSRILGEGWQMACKPVAHLWHEHSIFLATFRTGGVMALAAHLVIIAVSFLAAGKLYLKGLRWPFLLWILMMASHLFDRSNVFLVGGGYEFIFHWLAVLSPLLIASRMARITRETSVAE